MNKELKQALSSVIKYKLRSGLNKIPSVTREDLIDAGNSYYEKVKRDYNPVKGTLGTFKYWSYRKGMEKFISPLMINNPRPNKLLYLDASDDYSLGLSWDSVMNELDEQQGRCPSHAVELLELNELLESEINKNLDLISASIVKDLYGLNDSRKALSPKEVGVYYDVEQSQVYKLHYKALTMLSKVPELREAYDLYRKN